LNHPVNNTKDAQSVQIIIPQGQVNRKDGEHFVSAQNTLRSVLLMLY
jgi:hypothetical protein